MGKKRKAPTLEELLARPWCYYCERDFDDQKILIDHMKAKHFKCANCTRRLNTAGGLKVHMLQVHKEEIHKIENSIPGREGITPEIFGSMGIPDHITAAREEQIKQEFFRMEADHRAATGNPPPGASSGQGNAAKKQKKIETPEEIKKRIEEHKAKRAAERAAAENGTQTGSDSQPAQTMQPTQPTQTTHPSGEDPSTQPFFGMVNPPAAHSHGPGIFAPDQFSNHHAVQPVHAPYQQSISPASSGYPYAPPMHNYGANPASASPGYHQPPLSIPTASYTPRNPSNSGLPLAPGLPQRPNFDIPVLSRQQISQLHPSQVQQTAPHYGPPQTMPVNAQHANGHRVSRSQGLGPDFGDALHSLIKSEGHASDTALYTNARSNTNITHASSSRTDENGSASSVIQASQTTPPTVSSLEPTRAAQIENTGYNAENLAPHGSKPDSGSVPVASSGIDSPSSATSKPKPAKKQKESRKTILIYGSKNRENETISPEERMAALGKYPTKGIMAA